MPDLELSAKVAVLESRLVGLEDRADRIENAVNDGFSSIHRKLDGIIDSSNENKTKISNHDRDITDLKDRVKRVDILNTGISSLAVIASAVMAIITQPWKVR